MQKKLGMFISFLFLGAMTLVGAGCSDNRRMNDCAPVCEQPCQPVCPEPCRPVCPEPCNPCPPACAPCPPPCAPCPPPCPPCPPACAPCPPPCAPCPPPCAPECKVPVKCCHPCSNQLKCFDFITVSARNPRMCILGDQYPLDFDVRACDDVCDVVVTTHLPEGVTYIKSQPEAKVEGRKLTWNIGSMSKGECKTTKVTVKCECEGELCACFCATATPVRFCSLLCAKPILSCEKCGPDQVCPGDPVNYTITVTNTGSCAAEEVVVTDNIPPELEHSSCARTLTFKLGCLQPCETKRVNVCLTAVKRGKACNTAVVTACNADSTSCQWCTLIACCGVDIVKNGPKEVPIGKNADYVITLTNTGDLPLTDIVVTDVAPNSTSIVSANGAQICGNQAVWKLRQMKAGEKVTFNITLTTCVPGCFTNKVNVTDCQQCNACSEFTTRWKGRPALDVCSSGGGAICVGENASYTITVTNQGSEADSNVVVTVRVPEGLTPVSANGDSPGKISGQTVTFAPISTLRPRQTLSYRLDVTAKSPGDARVIIEVSSDAFKTPIVEQESTIVN